MMAVTGAADIPLAGVFAVIERSSLSVWMREGDYAYFVALIFHAFGMALLVGGGIAVCLGLLGVTRDTALQRLRGFFPVMWIGAALAAVSGVLLLAAYPAKAMTNPLFAVKFACLVGAALLLRAAFAAPSRERLFAALSLALWIAGVAARKLLLHTATVLTVT